MTNNTDKECMEKICAIIYEIWNARNIFVFQEKNIPLQEISNTAFKRLHEYQAHGENHIPNQSTKPKGCSNNISWSPPLRGILEANVDAHQSSDGHWFSALGLNATLDWIEKLEERQVILEMDSQIIVTAIKGKAEIRKGWGGVVRRCITFLESNPNSDIRWVQRGANRVAHELAKWVEFEPNSEWSNCVPMCIWPLIQKEKSLVIPV
ncbi:unnamed protein product [Trifolium pratense]|uniref:Uncharacterized protein n=1 Tax=Trifolium pratense TaxID=57577 RepID=A0ACB0IT86_TRIPR|nr:unnamed protein product [Trifolium pratense]